MKFSICIPNYNYGQYIGETIKSVLDQDYKDFEILISDNNSTDDSWDVIQHFANSDTRIKAWRNPSNLGFSGNLDMVSSKASGEYHILVSSDDLMNRGALRFYADFLSLHENSEIIFSSSCYRIDEKGINVGYEGPKNKLWKNEDLDLDLSNKFKTNVYKVAAGEILKRCLESFYGPFNFVSTCYSANDYSIAGGYGGGRMYNPDKWLHWRLLTHVKQAFYIDFPLFSYRWHNTNQFALEKNSGSIKYFIDEYRNSLEINSLMLNRSTLSIVSIEKSFINNIIEKYAFKYIVEGNLIMSKRVLSFGLATSPNIFKIGKYYRYIYLLSKTGKIGIFLFRLINKIRKPF